MKLQLPEMLSLLLLFSSGVLVQGQTQESTRQELDAIKEELKALREDQLKMRQDLEQIKAFLLKQLQAAQGDPYQGKTASVNDDPFKGSADARVTLIEFSDFQ